MRKYYDLKTKEIFYSDSVVEVIKQESNRKEHKNARKVVIKNNINY